jgi:hypothetical protein
MALCGSRLSRSGRQDFAALAKCGYDEDDLIHAIQDEIDDDQAAIRCSEARVINYYTLFLTAW